MSTRVNRLGAVAIVAALAIGAGVNAGAAHAADDVKRTTSVSTVQMSQRQVEKVRRALAEPEARKAVFGAVSTSFGTDTTATASGVVSRLDRPQGLSFGWDRNHAWIIASYSDIVRGVISAGVVACKRYLPALPFLCDYIGRLLKDLARGYAPLSNHGVWAELYINGQVRSGRY